MNEKIKYQKPEILIEKFEPNDELMEVRPSEVDTAPFFFSDEYQEEFK